MSENVPVLKELSVASDPKRYEDIRAKFKELYNTEPEFFARAPGRVNLIGEHVDYCGYPVLPMAIENDTIVGVKIESESKTIKLHNLDKRFPDRTFSKVYDEIVIDKTKHDWMNYFMAGYKGVLENNTIAIDKKNPVGFTAIISGNVPSGSGLSSSSALVCVAALATMHANGKSLSKTGIAELCAVCERYIGTQGGGMDQAISFLAERGKASKIEFNPLKATLLELPEGATFVVANSLVESNKYVTASTCFNMRVVECRLAAILLAKKLGLDWKSVRILAHVQNLGPFTLDQLIEHVKNHLHSHPYTLSEIASELGVSEEELSITYVQPIKADAYHLHHRALHVYMESKLVRDFANILSGSKNKDSLKDLGELMNQSHFSCSNNYDCSCPELDRLTEICRKAGAYGSRLTGAGWGGCTVSLIPPDIKEKFFTSLRDEYYAKEKPGALSHLSDVLFCSSPGTGAFVLKNTNNK
eukprot:TRINITY_DN8357_c0_g1_i1.p1 TRINITY_DN8357_c0_g1~~TRINITY_DN8357_c0_g1_i1.p1  ORF type:complete len:472 (+),score=69.66 TRINITY_DN8357_c0_g1_i1:37-1452(+)